MESINNLKNQGKDFKSEVSKQTLGYLTTALGLVAGLAWNDAIKALIEVVFPLERDTVLVKFIYAVAITIVIVILTRSLVRVLQEQKALE